MTYQQAIVVRQLQLEGRPMFPTVLDEAIRIIQATKTRTKRPGTKGIRQPKAKLMEQGSTA